MAPTFYKEIEGVSLTHRDNKKATNDWPSFSKS